MQQWLSCCASGIHPYGGHILNSTKAASHLLKPQRNRDQLHRLTGVFLHKTMRACNKNEPLLLACQMSAVKDKNSFLF